MERYNLMDIQRSIGPRLVTRVDSVLREDSQYINLRGVGSISEVLDSLRDKHTQAYPRKWIKSCWEDFHGSFLPSGYKNAYALAQAIYTLCEKKDVSPALFVPTIPKEPRKGMIAYLCGANKWLSRENDQESFHQWLTRIGG